MNKLLPFLSFIVLMAACRLLIAACRQKEKNENATEFFPVSSFLKGQVKSVDSSLYRIMKIETRNGRTDTTYIPRQDFSKLAGEFTSLPDIGSDKYYDDYTETQMYDEALESFILTYTTKEEDNEIQRADVMLGRANEEGTNDVKTVILRTLENKGKTSIEKNMVWYVDRKFTIITKTFTKDQPEKINKLEVVWNNF
jgi:hypothetical protein